MALYGKNLTEDVRLRLTENDMNFLREESERRSVSISECIRSIIGEYRRSLDMVNILSDALKIAKEGREKLSHGDTESDFNNILQH